jgi:hypothetical protein
MDAAEQPRTTGERVDTWEMVVIHRWFKREFAQLPALVRGVAPGDRVGARYVAEFVEMMAELLHSGGRTPTSPPAVSSPTSSTACPWR